LGGIAAAAAVASGIANVKKIYATQPGSTPSDSGSSSATPTASLTSSLSSVNTELGQGIVSRETGSTQASQENKPMIAVPVDEVTRKQIENSNKVETSSI
jgi:hypothetical protein